MNSLPSPLFDEPVFQEGKPLPDPKSFRIPHPSDNATYAKLGDLLKTQTARFDTSRIAPDALYPLEQALGLAGHDVVNQITKAGSITFHAVGDTGASAEKAYRNELRVSDAMVFDFAHAKVAERPSFLFHLGDVVYNFSEAKYYYDEFYDPFRNYPRAIFAIPGNHDSFVAPGTPAKQTPLEIFSRNFCALSPTVTPEAFSLHRTATTQPGPYFALDAPFVRLIGLFSNALEDPGVISSEGGRWPGVPDIQLDFFRAQLRKLSQENYVGAVLVAVHHPPFAYESADGSGGNHGCSPNLLHDIDTICSEVGIYPHAILSGHAHNYQRYTRKLTFHQNSIEVPFIVCGSGGHNILPLITPASSEPAFGANVSYMDKPTALVSTGLTLEKYEDKNYGYLLVNVDSKQLQIQFRSTAATENASTVFDLVKVDLKKRRLITT